MGFQPPNSPLQEMFKTQMGFKQESNDDTLSMETPQPIIKHQIQPDFIRTKGNLNDSRAVSLEPINKYKVFEKSNNLSIKQVLN